MSIWSFLRPFTPNRPSSAQDSIGGMGLSPYVGEYLAAIDRTAAFGFEAPVRLLVKKDCVDMQTLQPVLLDYFARSPPDSMIGQTAAIHFALVPLLYDKTGIPFNLSIGWIVRKGKAIYQHDERLIQRFIEGNTQAWLDEGCPFHLWLTSPACEILDVIDPIDPDRAFGLCDLGLGSPELGYVSIAELTALRGTLGLPVERDLHFDAKQSLTAYALEARRDGRIVA